MQGTTAAVPAVTEPLLERSSNPRGKVQLGKGILLLLISALGFSTMSCLASVVSRWFSSSEIMFTRCLMQLIFSYFVCCGAGVSPVPSRKEADNLLGWVILRGIFGALCNWILYYSLSQLPLADASSLYFTQPMFTLILAPLVINESIAPRQVLAVLMAVCGVFFIARPTWLFGGSSADATAAMHNIDAQIPRWLAIVVCLSGSFVASLVFVTVTHIGKRAHWAQLVFSFAAFGTVVAAIPLYFQWSPLRMPSSPWPFVMLFLLGCCALLGQSTFNHGMQLCQSAVTSSLVRQTDLVFAFIYQALFLNHPLTWYTLTGGSFVLCGALVDAVPKLVTELKSRGYIGNAGAGRKAEC
ncbi:hypothetical protein FOZ62_002606 [Perkinsus olseni]|uniref:EamA domain-containing protein n=1 Tax=Perkinsus olseni TaxID=32597 RepID=A0A7J6QQH4_PEROL|nr:hypothetical protein FOZ62_002606 [Perkinsus olseni]